MNYLKKSFCVAFLATGMTSVSLAQQPTIFLADPTVFKDKGMYYLYGTGSNQGFPVYASNDLESWKPAKESAGGLALTRGEAFGTAGFWAPQIVAYKGIYYMAYTANEQIAIAKASSPAGPFRQDKAIALSGSGKQIDPFLFFDEDGKVYLYHVKLQHGNRIFVTEMKPDLSDVVTGTEKECIAGADEWENTAKTDWPVTEGPTVLKHKNTYYLIYSANDFRNKDYAVGYATAASPLGPWKKYEANPVISRHTIGYNGTGHGDVFFDKKDQMYYVMHTHRSEDKVSPRATGMLRLAFKRVKGGPDVLVADTTSFRWLQAE
jgi:beta-xylosidase